MRVLFGGILGGIVMFCWGAISHLVLPLGQMGISNLPNEEAVLSAMRQSIPEPGLYFFPGMDMTRKQTPEEERAWQQRYDTGPVGLLAYQPHGGSVMSPSQLGVELGSDIVAALVAAILLTMTAVGYAGRVAFSGALGLIAWLSISISYWNWYKFPSAFTLAEGFDQVMGWLIAGIVLAALVKGKSRAVARAG